MQVVQLLKRIRELGMYAGIALKPSTPEEAVYPYVDAGLVDLVSWTAYDWLVTLWGEHFRDSSN